MLPGDREGLFSADAASWPPCRPVSPSTLSRTSSSGTCPRICARPQDRRSNPAVVTADSPFKGGEQLTQHLRPCIPGRAASMSAFRYRHWHRRQTNGIESSFGSAFWASASPEGVITGCWAVGKSVSAGACDEGDADTAPRRADNAGGDDDNAPGDVQVVYLARRTSIGVSDRHGVGDLFWSGMVRGVILLMARSSSCRSIAEFSVDAELSSFVGIGAL